MEYSSTRLQQRPLDALHGHGCVFSEPELQVRDLSQRPTVPGRHLDMLACRCLLKKSVDAPEVNENIWFLPDLFTSQLGHMSWQVTRVQRRLGDRSTGLFSLQHGARRPHPRDTAEYVQKADGRPRTLHNEPSHWRRARA